MIVYNFTKIGSGVNEVGKSLDIFVWAMDEGGFLPKSIFADVDGQLIPLCSIQSASTPPPKEEVADKTLPDELLINIDITLNGETIEHQKIPYLIAQQKLKRPAEMGSYGSPAALSHDNQLISEILPVGLSQKFLFHRRVYFREGRSRVRVVAVDRFFRKHWVDGFWVSRSAPVTIAPSTVPPARDPMPAWAKECSALFGIAIRKCLKFPQDFLEALILWLVQNRQLDQKWEIFILVNPERLGHLVANTEIFLSERQCGLFGNRGKSPALFVGRYAFVEDHGWIDTHGKVANNYLLNLWDAHLKVIREGLISRRMLSRVERLAPALIHRQRPHGHRDIHGCLDRSKPSVSLSEEQLAAGARIARAIGIADDSKVVLFHYRSPEYVGKVYGAMGANLETLRYGYRNTDPNSYEKALTWLVDRGYTVVRVGTEKTPWAFKHPQAVDFASTRQDDWMDLYLFSRCEAFFGGTSGIYTLAELFRKPILFTNFAPIGHVYSSSARYLSIFKMLIDQETNRPVPLSEQLATDLGWTIHGEKILKDRYAYFDNSQDEIAEATEELILRIENSWTDGFDETERQSRFWNQYSENEYHSYFAGRVGGKFLENHADWLLK